MLTIETPAADRALLTIEELRAAAGVSDAGQDATLQALGLRVSDLIARECAIAAAGATPPTLRRETLTQTFRCPRGDTLMLARRFVSEVTLVREDGADLEAGAYELDGGAGMLLRLCDGRSRCWGRNVSVTFAAGFDEVPGDLKQAAIWAVRETVSAEGRDPLLRSETVDGLGRMDWQMGGTGRGTGSPLPPMVVDALAPYRTVPIA